MERVLRKSILQKGILQSSQRSFARRLAKGTFGKEDNLSNKFEFPKHKELFQEGYYNEENDQVT